METVVIAWANGWTAEARWVRPEHELAVNIMQGNVDEVVRVRQKDGSGSVFYRITGWAIRDGGFGLLVERKGGQSGA